VRAVVYEGAEKVAIEEVEDAHIEEPTDVLMRVTSSALCGSDLHMYDGRAGADPGLVLGHEPLGTVEEVGGAVKSVKRGDRVVVPTHLYCGYCFNCRRGRSASCLTVNPGSYGAAYGYAGMGPYRGAQAELLRVPFADANCVKLPCEPHDELEDDFVLLRALEAGVKAEWVLADSVYGDTRRLGMLLEERGQPYVLAVSGKAYVWAGLRQHRIGEVLEVLREGGLLPEDGAEEAGFKRLSAGNGSKGPRLYDWARLPLNPPMQEGFERWLLVRRSIEDPQELTAYTVFAPEGATLEELAKVAGSRWRVEIGFEEAKGEVGLAHYEVRSWHGWYRHITLALFAHALLATIRSAGLEVRKTPKKGGRKRVASLSEFKRKRGLSCD
jgi:hypothetical protein